MTFKDEKGEEPVYPEYEEIKRSEALHEAAKSEYKMNQRLAEFEDVAEDSVYPLMTKDPQKAKEYLVKVNVNDQHLNNVFNSQADQNINL